jgi:hypothetical protein
MAALAQARGRFAEAEALYSRALAILEPALGADHPHVAACQAGHAQARKAAKKQRERTAA